MTIKMTCRRATPGEMMQIRKGDDEAERLYFENGLPGPLIEAESCRPLQADTEADQPVIVAEA